MTRILLLALAMLAIAVAVALDHDSFCRGFHQAPGDQALIEMNQH
jgi:hypothetical protein